MKKELAIILKAIAEAKEFTRKGHEVHVDISSNNRLDTIYPDRLIDILLILQDDEKILKIKVSPEWSYRPDTMDLDTAEILSEMGGDFPIGDFTVDILEGFDEWCANYWAESSTQDLLPTRVEDAISVTEPEIVYQISYTTAREILLDNKYQLAKPDFDSENDVVFDYLYKNPNKKITRDEIEEQLKIELKKSLHKIVENLGFKGELKKVFFDVSKNSIQFNNPITRECLKSLGINRIKLK